ncbi:unnamed protein product [Lepeophtheirus salmonis]|uniref:(salmon louse) hypothetical protein n=1 Tax=Lepeophtheirus salmonis TaxID=72036 RepID=A0A7R8CD44_LEPSM|nr:unnamed protein product [Lepeophtheirus salmonis]CAF2775780.1 unnamed protein product [Lepeophtheirus salmonis]
MLLHGSLQTMASLVTGYSSDDEEEESYEHSKPKNGQIQQRQKDVNYDDVNMDMSEESDKEDRRRRSDSDSNNVFANTEDYKAYRKQFKDSKGSKKSSDDDRRSSPSKNEDRHRSHRHHHRRREERKHDVDRHRRKHRKRSKSRERRRSRSRERPRSSREDQEYERMSKHTRKLKALGLVGHSKIEEDYNVVGGSGSTTDTSFKKASSGSASGILINEGNIKKQVEAQVAQVKQITGIELPKYYNPSAITPYAMQIKLKRENYSGQKPTSNEDKPSANESEDVGTTSSTYIPVTNDNSQSSSSYNNWESTNFGNSQANEKFRRLMGIKTTSQTQNKGSEGPENQKMFQDLDKQYEKARITTHTARGLGLGFSNPLVSNPIGAVDDGTKLSKK